MLKPIEVENCIVCGGDAHGTPGLYKQQGWDKPKRCGVCNGTGKVPLGANWLGGVGSTYNKTLPIKLYKDKFSLVDQVVVIFVLMSVLSTLIVSVVAALWYFNLITF